MRAYTVDKHLVEAVESFAAALKNAGYRLDGVRLSQPRTHAERYKLAVTVGEVVISVYPEGV